MWSLKFLQLQNNARLLSTLPVPTLSTNLADWLYPTSRIYCEFWCGFKRAGLKLATIYWYCFSELALRAPRSTPTPTVFLKVPLPGKGDTLKDPGFTTISTPAYSWMNWAYPKTPEILVLPKGLLTPVKSKPTDLPIHDANACTWGLSISISPVGIQRGQSKKSVSSQWPQKLCAGNGVTFRERLAPTDKALAAFAS